MSFDENTGIYSSFWHARVAYFSIPWREGFSLWNAVVNRISELRYTMYDVHNERTNGTDYFVLDQEWTLISPLHADFVEKRAFKKGGGGLGKKGDG